MKNVPIWLIALGVLILIVVILLVILLIWRVSRRSNGRKRTASDSEAQTVSPSVSQSVVKPPAENGVLGSKVHVEVSLTKRKQPVVVVENTPPRPEVPVDVIERFIEKLFKSIETFRDEEFNDRKKKLTKEVKKLKKTDGEQSTMQKERELEDIKKLENVELYKKYFEDLHGALRGNGSVKEEVKHEKECRYKTGLPSHTRYHFKNWKDRFATDFIHANLITLPNGSKYILTQSPMSANEEEQKVSTIEKFWWMAFELETKQILMLTSFVEREIEKCAQHFPEDEGGVLKFDKLTVKCLEKKTEFDGDLVVRKISMKFEKPQVNLPKK